MGAWKAVRPGQEGAEQDDGAPTWDEGTSYIGGLTDSGTFASLQALPPLSFHSHSPSPNLYFLRWKIQIIGASCLSRGVTQCDDPNVALGSENSPVWPRPSALGR